MAADRRQSKKGQASGNKLLAVTATPLPSSLLHQTLTRSDERRTRMANPRDVNNLLHDLLLHDLHDKQIVNLDTTLRETLHPHYPHYPASSLVLAHPPPSRRRPPSRVRRLYGLPNSADFAAGRGGLLQVPDVSWSPCRRSHPAGGAPPRQPDCGSPCCLRAKSKRSASGASTFGATLTLNPYVHSRYGPATRGHPSRWRRRWVSERRFPSALPSKLRGAWLLPR